jgi:hypothetical protein
MSTLTVKQTPTPTDHLDRAASELAAARTRLTATSLAERRALMEDCLDRLVQLSPEWIEAACEAKGIPAGSPLRGEEIAAGPVATARHLRLLIDNYKSVESTGQVHGLDLTLDWFPNPDHVAIYEAEAQGYLRAVGLDVRTRVPSDPSAPIKQVAAGRTDLAISYEPEVLLAREQGLPVVAVAALVQRPLTSLMATRKSGVRSVRDLRGKRVGTAGIPYQEAYLKTILQRANVPESSVKTTNVGASLLPAMLSGKVDATLGAFWNVEGVELRQRRQRPWIAPVDRLGVPDYDELVLVANSDKLDA